MEKGIIGTNDLVYGSWWFRRNIDGLKEANDEEARKYMDMRDDDSEETEMCLANLHNRLLNKMNKKNIREYHVNWKPSGGFVRKLS